ncbi:MAG TPA: portal protein [Alphaproteobacteria bacterium]|nr:portal protein [Alphaproteobacteria bacterium]
MTAPDPRDLLDRHARARARRAGWEPLWQECYDYALPLRDGAAAPAGAKRGDRLFDGTAPDAVDQLAASLLAQLAPPWSRWFGFQPGPDLPAAAQDGVAAALEAAAETVQAHFDRSNLAVELHQAFLDLATAGTACLLFEEAPPGGLSAFRFQALPLADLALEEGPDGRLSTAWRRHEMTLAELRARWPTAELPAALLRDGAKDPALRWPVVESVQADDAAHGHYAVLDADPPLLLAAGRFATSPFIAFRWLKAPGEGYGRSPVMKALPDIKTANKVVELVLKNASIAVTGIWQADDDGVLNPAAIRLQPGTIIPKAVGSAGLTPLQPPGRFDVSQVVLDDLRSRIRRALLADRLAPLEAPRMTATEVLERSAEMARLLGATYGRLQAELLTPLVLRGLAILRRRGEVPDFPLDGRSVALVHRSPLAQAQAQRDATAVLRWLESAAALGPEALAAIDAAAAARWLGRAFGVPPELLRASPAPAPSAAEAADATA